VAYKSRHPEIGFLCPPNEQRVVLPSITWEKFEQILSELPPDRQIRLTYHRGKLEMMTPVAEHDRCQRLLDSLILVLADELDRPVEAIAPVLIESRELDIAIEPDACYYLLLGGRGGHGGTAPTTDRVEIHLPADSPPDLLVEVALTQTKLEKLPLYTRLAIPEVWRYITTAGENVLKGKLEIYHLQGDRHTPQRHSTVFPGVSSDRILEFIEQSDSMSLSASLRLLRAWIQEKL
jgi:Uma2 family endonuclease